MLKKALALLLAVATLAGSVEPPPEVQKFLQKIVVPVYAAETGLTYPAELLDLRLWKLTLPINTASDPGDPDEIKQPRLATYTSQYFELNTPQTAVTFYSPAGGDTTSGSGYARSELRERRDFNNYYTFTDDCQATDKENEACWSSSDGYHIMTIDQTITHIPTTKPHVVVGQVHDDDDDNFVFRLEGKKLFVDANRYKKIIGNDGEIVLTENYELGTRFTIAFEVFNDTTIFYYNGQPAGSVPAAFHSGYFKAGMYVQSNEGVVNGVQQYGSVDIYDLKVCHGAAKTNCSHVQPAPPNQITPTPTASPKPTTSPTVPPSATPSPSPKPLAADIAPLGNPDGKVDIFDYNLMLQNFLRTGEPGFHPADIAPVGNLDGKIDIFDYNKLIEQFGSSS